jgi:hypothetical protein
MVLHCASRLGVLSEVYQNRYDILYAVGAIDEMPITSCDGSYFFEKDFKVSESESSNVPIQFSAAQEIQLTLPEESNVNLTASAAIIVKRNSVYLFSFYSSPSLDILRPPCLLS